MDTEHIAIRKATWPHRAYVHSQHHTTPSTIRIEMVYIPEHKHAAKKKKKICQQLMTLNVSRGGLFRQSFLEGKSHYQIKESDSR